MSAGSLPVPRPGPAPGALGGRPEAVSAATPSQRSGSLDRALTELAAELPELPVAEHDDRLAAMQELLHQALEKARSGQ